MIAGPSLVSWNLLGVELRRLVGCDGGRSLVRKHAEIDFTGWDASVSYLIAEVEMEKEPAWGIRRGKRGVNALGPAENGRVGIVLVEAEVRKGDSPSLDEVRDALVAVYETDFGLESATWISRFSDMARQATKYRKGRVILAGDAAHVHGPSGGLGLNIVQDAMNLRWKLAAPGAPRGGLFGPRTGAAVLVPGPPLPMAGPLPPEERWRSRRGV
jgi:2-polyprenyl-6-methoxyphenol hydroxylase-like FAD-dependent oxidoreductase